MAVDVAIVTAEAGELRALLVQRDEPPHRGRWALPGGFVGERESLEAAAARVLADKGGLREVYLEQLYTFGDPARDPRGRIISVAYYALVHPGRLAGMQLATLAVPWAGERGGPAGAHDARGRALPLAFDHAEMLGLVVLRLRGKLNYAAVGFELLPRSFTLRQLQQVHETILGRRLNKDSFRRRMLASGLIQTTGRSETSVGHRPAALYRFRRTAFPKR